MHTDWDPREGFSGLIVIGAVQHHLGMIRDLVIHLYTCTVHVVTQLRLMAIDRDGITIGLSLSLPHIPDSNSTGN